MPCPYYFTSASIMDTNWNRVVYDGMYIYLPRRQTLTKRPARRQWELVLPGCVGVTRLSLNVTHLILLSL